MPEGFRSLRTRARVTNVMLALQAVAAVNVLCATLSRMRLIDRRIAGLPVTLDEWAPVDGRVRASTALWLVVFGAAALPWLAWQYRAHANLRVLGARYARFTPAWGVAWWFIPFANLGKPFGAIRELWKASDPEAEPIGWQMKKTPRLLSWWWFLMVVVAFHTPIPTPWSSYRAPLKGQWLSDAFALLAEALSLPATALAVLVVRGITERQEAKAQRGTAAVRPDGKEADA